MILRRATLLILLVACLSWARSTPAHADEKAANSPRASTIEAVKKGLERARVAGANWHAKKTCFACHHQTLPMLAVVEAERVGLGIGREWLEEQRKHTHDYFSARVEDMRAGGHIPGGAASTGYGLWALALGNQPADETTAAMVGNLLAIQGGVRKGDRKPDAAAKLGDGRWEASCRRPPMQASLAGDTVLVLIGIERYATSDQRVELAVSVEKANRWLAELPLRDQQDRLWRMWGLHLGTTTDRAERDRVIDVILSKQRSDGGWSETDDRDSDAYSTGQTLYMLRKSGVAADHPALVSARDWLISRQLEDGSWRTESHVKEKVQPKFDNGDPHGEHQFLSTGATAWSTAGLASLLADGEAARP